MQGQLGAWLITVDQARIGTKCGEPGLSCRSHRQVEKFLRHPRPELATLRIDRFVAIAAAICDPPRRPAVCHCDRHAMAAGRYHMAQRRVAQSRRVTRTLFLSHRPARNSAGEMRRHPSFPWISQPPMHLRTGRGLGLDLLASSPLDSISRREK